MKSKTILTVMLTLVYLVILKIFYAFQGSLGSQIGVNQLDDSAVTYGLSSMVLSSDICGMASLTLAVILGFIWIPTVYKKIKNTIKDN